MENFRNIIKHRKLYSFLQMSRVKRFGKENRKTILMFCSLVAIILAGYFTYYFIVDYPSIYAAKHGIYAKNMERLVTIEKDMRGTVLQIIGGVLFLIGMVFTYRRTRALDETNKIDEKRRIQEYERSEKEFQYAERRRTQEFERYQEEFKYTEARLEQDKKKAHDELLLQQYSKASELLASDNISSRLSGIYLFEKIMNSNSNYYITILDILSSFVKENRNITNFDNFYAYEITEQRGIYEHLNLIELNNKYKIEKDTQAALDVIFRRNLEFEKEDDDFRIDLSNIYLCSVVLRGQSLYKINFTNTIITNSIFDGVNINISDFINSYLIKCSLSNSTISKSTIASSKFIDCTIKGSIFKNCPLDCTEFANSHFINHYFINCRLFLSHFYSSDLNFCQFNSCNIEDIDFCNSFLWDIEFTLMLDLASKKISLDGFNSIIKSLKEADRLHEIKFDIDLLEAFKITFPYKYNAIKIFLKKE